MVSVCAPALAATATDSDSNIFTPPEDQRDITPTFKESTGEKQRRAFVGGKDAGDGLGMFNRVRNIPSLTPQQRKQIVLIFTKAKSDFAPVKEQLDTLKAKYQNDPQKIMADPEEREKFLDLRRQVREFRKQLDDQVHFVLTDDQQRELEAMRKGELTPATFNQPMTVNDVLQSRGRAPHE
jgi:hypothetical protein